MRFSGLSQSVVPEFANILKSFHFESLHVNFPFCKTEPILYFFFKRLWVIYIRHGPSLREQELHLENKSFSTFFFFFFSDFKSRPVSAKLYFRSWIRDSGGILHIYLVGCILIKDRDEAYLMNCRYLRLLWRIRHVLGLNHCKATV